MPAVEAAVREMNSVAEFKFTTYADVSPDWVLDIDCYSLQTGPAEIDDNYSSGPRCLPCLPPAFASASASGAGSGPGAAQSPLHSAFSMSSVALVIAGRLSLTAVKMFLDALLYNNGNNAPDHQLALPPPAAAAAAAAAGPVRAEQGQGQGQGRVFRIKGALHVTGPQRSFVHVLQAVHDVFDIQPSPFLCGGEGDTTGGVSRFVFIGRSLDEAALRMALQGCVEVEG
jgi:G3E family GTPase